VCTWWVWEDWGPCTVGYCCSTDVLSLLCCPAGRKKPDRRALFVLFICVLRCWLRPLCSISPVTASPSQPSPSPKQSLGRNGLQHASLVRLCYNCSVIHSSTSHVLENHPQPSRMPDQATLSPSLRHFAQQQQNTGLVTKQQGRRAAWKCRTGALHLASMMAQSNQSLQLVVRPLSAAPNVPSNGIAHGSEP
jgi:hypothetical protein